MKYFTKDWYDTCQKTHQYYGLKTSKKAKKYSEKFFNKLFEKKLKKYRNLGYSTEYLNQLVDCNVEILKNILPEKILQKVADIRVLALGKASKKIKKMVKKFCKQNLKEVEQTIDNYNDYYQKIQEQLPIDVRDNFSFHDYVIASTTMDNNNLTLTFEEDTYIKIKNVTFINCKTDYLELFENSWWLYDEIYITKDGYEIMILLDRDAGIEETSLLCSEIKMELK